MTSLVIADIGIFVCQNNTFFTQCRKVLVNKNEDSKSRKIFWASLMVLPGSRHCNKYNAKFSSSFLHYYRAYGRLKKYIIFTTWPSSFVPQ